MSLVTSPTLPRVLVLGTGGTIAGSSAATQETGYVAGVVDVGDLIRAVPGVSELAQVGYEQFAQIDSCDMTLERQLALARRVQRAVAGDDVDAVVVTHGTDTLEETAYLLHLTLGSPKPVVIVGAMRPADAPGADGPANLRNAIVAAVSQRARGLGVLVVLGEEVHGAREVTKRHTTRVNAFASAHGPLGEVVGGELRLFARPTRPHGPAAFALGQLGAPPPVEVLMGRAGLPPSLVSAYVASGARGLVYVGHGNGNVPLDLQPVLAAVAASGVPVVRTSRVGAGVVTRNGAVADDRLGLIAGGDLGPGKARVLLALSLTQTDDPARLQGFFDTL